MKAKFITFLLAGLVIGLTNVSPAVAQDDVAVVVNSNNSASSVSMGELRKIFDGEKRSWPGGASIKLLVRTAGTHERTALLNLLGMSESDYKNIGPVRFTKARRHQNQLLCRQMACKRKRWVCTPERLHWWTRQK